MRCSAVLCDILPSHPLVTLRPRSGQRLPADPARLQALRFVAWPCAALQFITVPCFTFRSSLPMQLLGGLRPRYGLQNLQPMRENKPCIAVRFATLLSPSFPYPSVQSANAVKLCSHFFRLACFKLCQVVASELGPVVAKPFKHGRMNKRILYIRHVQNFGNDRH